MRVLLFGYFTKEMGGEGSGGVATYVRDIAVGLRDAGHTVAVWGANARFWKREWEGITLYGAPDKYRLYREWIRRPAMRISRRWLWATRGEMIYEDFKPDLFHSHSPHDSATYDFPAVPLVVTFHSVHFYTFAPNKGRRKIALEVYRRSMAEASYVIYPSSKVRKQVEELIGSQKPSRIISPLVDIGLFRPIDKLEARKKLGLPEGEVLIGFAGLLTGRKGEDLLVEASKGAPWTIVFAGTGPNLGNVKRRCRALGCRAVFLGDLSSGDMPYFYNAIDVFVLPSRSETFGIVVIEAMACGKTVVVSHEVPEDAAPESLAYRVGLTPEEVRRGIEMGLSSPFPPDRLISHARKFSDRDRFVKEHLEVYSRVLEGKV